MNIQDNTVPPGLKRKLEKEFSQDLPLGHYQQIVLVLNKLVQFVDHNKFLPCWKELKQSINMVRADNDNDGNDNSTISIIESKGKIKLKLIKGKYFYQCTILIDDGYPSTATHKDWGKPCILNLLSSNFPSKIETMLTSQAKELVRRLQDGMSTDDALQFSNPMKAPKDDDRGKKKDVKVRLNKDTLKGLKKDVETLSRVRDLREVNATVTQGKAHVLAKKTKERRDARRTIKKITKEEISKDLSIEEKEKKWAQEEAARIAGYDISEHDGSNPTPSLLSLVIFLKEKIQRLPVEVCPGCGEIVLPSDPNELKSLFAKASECKTDKEKKARKAAKFKRPMRTYCGHWWHYECLNKFMVEPPFGASCPVENCGRRVYHPDWPDDIRQLERAWAGEQARLREMEDAAMFL
jgi:hypothetical protein